MIPVESDNNPVKPFLFVFTDIFLVRLGFLLFSNLDKTDGLLGENLTSSASIDEREGRTVEQQDMACNDHVLLILLLNLRHLFYLYLVFPPKRLSNHIDYGCSGQVTIITGVSFQLYQSINFTIKK